MGETKPGTLSVLAAPGGRELAIGTFRGVPRWELVHGTGYGDDWRVQGAKNNPKNAPDFVFWRFAGAFKAALS